MKNAICLLSIIFISAFIFCFPSQNYAAPEKQLLNPRLSKPGTILVLHAYGANLPANMIATPSFIEALNKRGFSNENILLEYLDLVENPGQDYRRKIASFLRHKYANRKFDLIVAVHSGARKFLLEEGHELIKSAPVLSYLATGFSNDPFVGHSSVTLSLAPDFAGTLKQALDLFPQTRHVFFVIGNAEGDKKILVTAKKDFAPWQGKLTFTYSNDLSVQEILRKVAVLPSETIIIFANLFKDRTGSSFVPRDVAKAVAKTANSPVFAYYDSVLGEGILGGSMVSFAAEGKRAAKFAYEILSGELRLNESESVVSAVNTSIYDWQQLERWGVSAGKFPVGTLFINRPPTLWEQYKSFVILAVVIICILSLCVVALSMLNQRLKKMTTATRENEALFKAMLKNAPEAIILYDVDLKQIVNANSKAEQIFSYSGEKILQGSTDRFDFTQQLDIESVSECFMEYSLRALSGEEVVYERVITNGNGRSLTCEVRLVQLPYRKQRLLRGSFIDITERQHAKAALVESEVRFRAVSDNALVGIDIVQDDRFVYVNPALAQMFGYQRDELLGQNLQVIVHPEDRALIAEQLRARMTREHPAAHYEFRGRCKDGATREIEIFSAQVLMDGRPAVIANLLDITERKRAEEALSESEERFQLSMEATNDGLWDWNVETGEVYYSPACYHMLGYQVGEFPGTLKGWQDMLHPNDFEHALQANMDCAEGLCETFAVEYRLKAMNGEWRWILGRGKSIARDAQGRSLRLVGTNVDITERKFAEVQLRRLNRELHAVSECHQVLVRAVDEKTLLDDICTIVCDKAGYRMAWVGYAVHDEAKSVLPIAWAGVEEGYLADGRITWADTERGRGPTGTAIRKAEAVYLQDFQADPSMAPWRERAQSLGYRSIIAMPLKDDYGKAFGAFTVYSSESYAFTPEEIRLLEELADDMAFGVKVLSARREQATAKITLAESQALMHSIIDSTVDFIWSVDPVSFGLRSFNRSLSNYFLKLRGITLETGLLLEDLFPTEETVRTWHDLYQRTLDDGCVAAEYQTFAGGLTLELNFNLLRNDTQIFGISVFGKDITERKRAETNLANALQLETLLTKISAHFLEVSIQEMSFAITDAQRDLCRLLGFDLSSIYQLLPESAPGLKLTHIFREIDGPALPETIIGRESFPWCERQLLSGRIVAVNSMDELPGEASCDKGSWNQYHIKSSLMFPLVDKGSTVIGTISFDMVREERNWTEEHIKQLQLAVQLFANSLSRKKSEEEKIKLESQLHQIQKMDSIGSLAGGVAHDFNNKLSVILGCTYLATANSKPEDLQLYLDEIRRAAEQSADLTRQLLAFARKQTIAPTMLDLNDTVTGMLKMLHRLIGENISVKWLPAPELWRINFDPSQIDQILANLSVNARDAIAGSGQVTIETGNRVIDADYAAHHIEAVPGEYVCLAVSDNGCGMDKETMARSFEPFFTTKELGKGTGLGLATVFGIVKQNNGFIDVYSEVGIGSTFTIYLPRYAGQDEKADKQKDAPARGGRETILIVEDDLAILNIAARMLGTQGYRVLKANSATEAVRLTNDHLEIRLLISDVIMPELNGKELAHKLKSINPQLKVLFMSGYTSDVIAQHGVLDVGVSLIQKPFSLPDIAGKVREVLDSKPCQ